MNDLSYTQEFYLCAVNAKGNIPALDDGSIPACFVAGGIMDLTDRGLIASDEKDRLVIAKPWDDTLPYLKPLYEKIASFEKPKDAADIAAEHYVFGGKALNALLSAIGLSLVEAGCADDLTANGLFKEKIKYIPKPEAATRVIEKVRAEFLEGGTITDETRNLAALLDRGNLIRNYFSKVETAALKKRIKEVRTSGAWLRAQKIRIYVALIFIAIAVAIIVPNIMRNLSD
jgi:hypothetical protein